MNQNFANAMDQLFGKLSLDLFDEDKRSNVYAELEIMESNYPEAGIVLGQLYQDNRNSATLQYTYNYAYGNASWNSIYSTGQGGMFSSAGKIITFWYK